MSYTFKAGDKVLINPQDDFAEDCLVDTTEGGVYELTDVFTDLELTDVDGVNPVFVVFTDDIGEEVVVNDTDVTLFKQDEGE